MCLEICVRDFVMRVPLCVNAVLSGKQHQYAILSGGSSNQIWAGKSVGDSMSNEPWQDDTESAKSCLVTSRS